MTDISSRPSDPHRYGKQAYTASHNPHFWEAVGAKNLDEVVAYINAHCGTTALRFIDDDPNAVEAFKTLKAKFDALG